MIMSTTAQTIRRFQASSQNQPNSPGSSLTRFVMVGIERRGSWCRDREDEHREDGADQEHDVGRSAGPGRVARRGEDADADAPVLAEVLRRASRPFPAPEPRLPASPPPMCPCAPRARSLPASRVARNRPTRGRAPRRATTGTSDSSTIGTRLRSTSQSTPLAMDIASVAAGPHTMRDETADRSVPLNRHVRPMPPSTQRSRRPSSARRSGRRSRCGGSARRAHARVDRMVRSRGRGRFIPSR